MYYLTHVDHYAPTQVPRSSGFLINTYTCAYAATRGYPTSACVLSCLVLFFLGRCRFSRVFCAITALHGRLAGRFKPPLAGRCNDFAPSRPKNCHRQKQPSRPGPRKKKNTAPSRPGPRKTKTTAPSRLGKKKPAPSRFEKKTTSRPAMNSKIHRPEGGNWKQIPPACLFFSLSCCTFISYCSLVRSIF